MERRKHILVRDEDGNQRVILEIVTGAAGHLNPPRYELPNRERVSPTSDTEFVVDGTGAILTKMK